MFRRLLPIKVFCCGVICFLCQMTLSDCEVTLVTRGDRDNFRIGQDDCTEIVCTTTASCQQDGSCLCNAATPTFRNPIIVLGSGSPSYGSSYGCITNNAVDQTNTLLGKSTCKFKPFQVIPNDQNGSATKFDHKDSMKTFTFETCSLTSLEAKYVNSKTRTKITWLDETFVHFNMSNTALYFQWKKSVPQLQGLIITMNLFCKSNQGYGSECFHAKVLGTWSTSVAERSSTSVSNRIPSTKTINVLMSTSSKRNIASQSTNIAEMTETSVSFSSPTKWYGIHPSTPSRKLTWITSSEKNFHPSQTTIVSPKTETISKPLSCKSNQSDESSNTTIIAVLVSILVLLFIMNIALILLWLKERRKRKQKQRPKSEEMQSRNVSNLPDANYAVPSGNYDTLQENRRDNGVEHVYQGLVGISEKDVHNSDVSRSAYENPSAQDYEEPEGKKDYEELDLKRRDTEHAYQGLVRASERGANA